MKNFRNCFKAAVMAVGRKQARYKYEGNLNGFEVRLREYYQQLLFPSEVILEDYLYMNRTGNDLS
ncbi:MAG: hypothetical protein JSV83_21085 [Desulfobacterales bacterium]|nr:MAG: hypothetical protein JSV83_21085 [Desulfobacterales bacterium]